MNIKLLKVCTAIMLIANAESAFCVVPKKSVCHSNIPSAEAALSAKVQVMVDVEFEGTKQTIELVKKDGKPQRGIFAFKVNKIASGFGLKFLPTGNLGVDQSGTVTLGDGTEDGKIGVGITLEDGGGNVLPVKLGESSPLEFNPDSHKIGQWKLIFLPEVKGTNLEGTYTGGVKISVVATR